MGSVTDFSRWRSGVPDGAVSEAHARLLTALHFHVLIDEQFVNSATAATSIPCRALSKGLVIIRPDVQV